MIYEFSCPKCSSIEIEMTYKEYKKNKPTQCPHCSSEIQRIISDPIGFVKDCKTVGQLAERNMKNMTSKQGKIYEQRIKEDAANKEKFKQGIKDRFGITPEKQDGPPPEIKKALSNNDVNRINKYIETGQ